jgi:Tfp pilus assembly protein PilF
VVELADPAPAKPPASNDASIAIDGVSFASERARRDSSNLEAYSETFLPPDQFGWSALRSIRTERFKYIEAPEPELYDLSTDPGEGTNIVSTSTEAAGSLRRALKAISDRPAAPARPAGVDRALAEKLLSLGYVGSSHAMADGNAPNLPDPKSKLAVYNWTMKALELSENGDLAAALNAVAEAERLDPNVAQVEFLKGTLLGQTGRFEQAVVALERTLALNPRYAAARFKLALAFLRLGRADRATVALTEVVREDPGDFRAWHNLAAIAYSRGDLDEAERLERKALALSPEYAEAWNTLGAIALIRKQTDVALDALTNATRFAPQNGQAFQNLSLALRQAGRLEPSRAAAERACALDRRYCAR